MPSTAPKSATEAQSVPHGQPMLADPVGDWLCAWCLHRIANDRDRFSYNGRDEFVFTNPEGIRFAIITFEKTLGCREASEPTLQHTWFPAHAWCYGLCAECGLIGPCCDNAWFPLPIFAFL
jgi:hypothetical protein